MKQIDIELAQEKLKEIDIDDLLYVYKIYCKDTINTCNGKAFYFDDFLGWALYYKFLDL